MTPGSITEIMKIGTPHKLWAIRYLSEYIQAHNLNRISCHNILLLISAKLKLTVKMALSNSYTSGHITYYNNSIIDFFGLKVRASIQNVSKLYSDIEILFREPLISAISVVENYTRLPRYYIIMDRL